VGGKKETPRGEFRPQLSEVQSWKYLSIDPKTKPDFLCSAENIPASESSFDGIVLCEVVEHLEKPEAVLKEVTRVLKSKGQLVMSMPFMFGVHADPHDFQRWTASKIKLVLENLGYQNILIRPMGGLLAAIVDLFELDCYYTFTQEGRLPLRKKILRFLIRKIFISQINRQDRQYRFSDFINTGYFITAVKK
jgi:SAM-dependent methyltransferase